MVRGVAVRVVDVLDLVRLAGRVYARPRDGTVRVVTPEELARLARKGGVLVSACAECNGTIVMMLWTSIARYKRELESQAAAVGATGARSPFAGRTVYVVMSIVCDGGAPAYAEFLFAPWRLSREELGFLEKIVPWGPRTRVKVFDAREPVIPYVPGLAGYIEAMARELRAPVLQGSTASRR